MITRDLTAVITDPQGDLLALGTLEVTPATRSQVIADPDALVAGTQIYGITTGALDGTPTIQAPGRYIFEIKDSLGDTIGKPLKGTVSDDVATPISLQEILQTNVTVSATSLTEGSAITLLGIGTGVVDQVISVVGGVLAWISRFIEGTEVLSTGEAGGTKFLREDGDGSSSWQAVAAGTDENWNPAANSYTATGVSPVINLYNGGSGTNVQLLIIDSATSGVAIIQLPPSASSKPLLVVSDANGVTVIASAQGGDTMPSTHALWSAPDCEARLYIPVVGENKWCGINVGPDLTALLDLAGTRAMTGALDMGAFAITNVGQYETGSVDRVAAEPFVAHIAEESDLDSGLGAELSSSFGSPIAYALHLLYGGQSKGAWGWDIANGRAEFILGDNIDQLSGALPADNLRLLTSAASGTKAIFTHSVGGAAEIAMTAAGFRVDGRDVAADGAKIDSISAAAPASASDTGFAGEIRFDDNYIYRCNPANTWKRTPVAFVTW